MSELIKRLLDLPYPTKCVVCRGAIKPGRPRFCEDCAERLPRSLHTTAAFLTDCVSALSYSGGVAEAIKRFKFDGCQAYAYAFGELIAERVYEDLWGGFDMITWAPLPPDRLHRRGYDQAYLLARQAGKRLGLPVISTLRKKRGIPQQSLADSPAVRRANILGAYSVKKPESIAGARVLVIDDVITTGATISECAKTLRLAGAADVLCATLAKAGNK